MHSAFLVEFYDATLWLGTFCSRNEKENLCYDTVSGLVEDEEAEVINACEDAITIFCSTSRMKELEQSKTRRAAVCTPLLPWPLVRKKEMKFGLRAASILLVCVGGISGAPIKVPGSGEATARSIHQCAEQYCSNCLYIIISCRPTTLLHCSRNFADEIFAESS